ncbi:hypothetical protein ACM73M_22540 [Pseudomonas aeruginosa]
MIRPQDCEILQWRSLDDEAAFFACMGRFFASARVRRECGGYPLSDGPYHRWFVLRRQGDTGLYHPRAPGLRAPSRTARLRRAFHPG